MNFSVIPLTLFLLVTFLGIVFYLLTVYLKWKETTIGFWSLATFTVSIAIFNYILSWYFLNNSNTTTSLQFYKFAMIFAFLGFWGFGISPLIARRNFIDIFLLTLITFITAFLIVTFLNSEVEFVIRNGIYQIKNNPSPKNRFDQFLLLFFLILYIILARDSEKLYRASKLNEFKDLSQARAWTHLLAWQFWIVGMLMMNFIRSSLSVLQFSLPLLLLLVPLVTLGSRPFDWLQEGFEPIMIILLDKLGNPLFTWKISNQNAPLLEGSSISSVENMVANFANETVRTMQIHFESSSLYVESTEKHISLLLTTGHHQSFQKLLYRIHQIILNSLEGPSEFGMKSYSLPNELKWLISQLLPISDKVNVESNKMN